MVTLLVPGVSEESPDLVDLTGIDEVVQTSGGVSENDASVRCASDMELVESAGGRGQIYLEPDEVPLGMGCREGGQDVAGSGSDLEGEWGDASENRRQVESGVRRDGRAGGVTRNVDHVRAGQGVHGALLGDVHAGGPADEGDDAASCAVTRAMCAS